MKLILLFTALLMAGCATTQKHTKAYDDYMSKIDSALASKQITELQASQMRYEAEQLETQIKPPPPSFGQRLSAALVTAGAGMQQTAYQSQVQSNNWQQQNDIQQIKNDVYDIKRQQQRGY